MTPFGEAIEFDCSKTMCIAIDVFNFQKWVRIGLSILQHPLMVFTLQKAFATHLLG
jgi:hypothetical protein